MTKKTERYYDILHAARKIMADKGFEKARVIEITKAAGVAKGTYYLYFDSKMAVLIAIATKMREQMIAEASQITYEKKSVKKQFQAIISLVFKVTNEYRDILPALHTVSAMDSERWYSEQRIKSPYYDFVFQLLKKGQRANEFHADIDLEVVSQLIVGMIEHAIHDCYLYQSNIAPERYQENIYRAICMIVSKG